MRVVDEPQRTVALSIEEQSDSFLKEDAFRDIKVNDALIKASVDKLHEIGMTDLASEIGYLQHRMFALSRSVQIAKRIIKDYRAERKRASGRDEGAPAVQSPAPMVPSGPAAPSMSAPVQPDDRAVLQERVLYLERQISVLESAQLTRQIVEAPVSEKDAIAPPEAAAGISPEAVAIQVEQARKAERERIIGLLIQDNADLGVALRGGVTQ